MLTVVAKFGIATIFYRIKSQILCNKSHAAFNTFNAFRLHNFIGGFV